MGKFDFVSIRQLNYVLAAAGMLCLFAAAMQLKDPNFIILSLGVSAFAYFIGRKWQEGDERIALHHPFMVYATSSAFLMASFVVLLFGPDAVDHFRWLFFGMAVYVGSRLKAA